MPRTCTICSHSQRAEIELSVTNGTPYRDIALQHGVGHMAVQRHMLQHIKQAAKQLQVDRDDAKTLDVLAQLNELNEITWKILRASKDNAKTYGLALQAGDRIKQQIELQAKLLGDLDEGVRLDIHLDPQWVSMRELIFTALSPFPDALHAVARALYEEGERGQRVIAQ